MACGVRAGVGQYASERCVSVARWALAKCRRRGHMAVVLGEGCDREREIRVGKRVVCMVGGRLVVGSASLESQDSRGWGAGAWEGERLGVDGGCVCGEGNGAELEK